MELAHTASESSPVAQPLSPGECAGIKDVLEAVARQAVGDKGIGAIEGISSQPSIHKSRVALIIKFRQRLKARHHGIEEEGPDGASDAIYNALAKEQELRLERGKSLTLGVTREGDEMHITTPSAYDIKLAIDAIAGHYTIPSRLTSSHTDAVVAGNDRTERAR